MAYTITTLTEQSKVESFLFALNQLIRNTQSTPETIISAFNQIEPHAIDKNEILLTFKHILFYKAHEFVDIMAAIHREEFTIMNLPLAMIKSCYEHSIRSQNFVERNVRYFANELISKNGYKMYRFIITTFADYIEGLQPHHATQIQQILTQLVGEEDYNELFTEHMENQEYLKATNQIPSLRSDNQGNSLLFAFSALPGSTAKDQENLANDDCQVPVFRINLFN